MIQCCSSVPLMSSAGICKASYTLCGFTGIVTKPPSNAGFRLYHFMLVYHGDRVGLHRHGVLNLFCGNTQSTALATTGLIIVSRYSPHEHRCLGGQDRRLSVSCQSVTATEALCATVAETNSPQVTLYGEPVKNFEE